MATRVFSDEELEALRSFPAIGKDELIRCFTLTSAKSLELKELDEFLLARAMEHDSPSLLFRLGCEYLRSAKVIRPGVVTLLEKVGTARQAAEGETHARVAHLLTGERAPGLDGLLVFDAKLKSSRLTGWSPGRCRHRPTAWAARWRS
ncbi:DUF4158 domain-containing protein [Streptomyces sp. NPDC037389]|uniref:DUF4158 domain-containing protein n=1 Tax=Streptomyces sp. NPDC037389 TaxID=3155369 RepID=UPI00340674F9